MKTRFSADFEALRGYLASNVPGISSVVTHWVKPPDAQDGLAMLFPHSNHMEDGMISCGFNLWFHTMRTDPRKVAAVRVAVMEEVFDAAAASHSHRILQSYALSSKSGTLTRTRRRT